MWYLCLQVKLSLGLLRALSKILLLEDDLLFAETLVDLLEEEEYEVTHTPNGQTALEKIFNSKFDLYILDINVPIINGVTLLKELRDADDNTPTIFLTSHKDKEMLKKGFLSGADDYLTKPFDNDELILRLEALLRRVKKDAKECISLLCHEAQYRRFTYDSQELELSRKEYELLLVLVRHVNKPVPKELIFSELWNISETPSDGAIRVYINRLKQLLPQIKIENIRGIGYRLVS